MSKHRDLWPGAGALLVIVAVLALGFHYLGPRERRRAISEDARRVEHLRTIATAIAARGGKELPATLANLAPGLEVNLKDPVTNAVYEYRPISATTYELCAVFSAGSVADDLLGRGPPAGITPEGATVTNWTRATLTFIDASIVPGRLLRTERCFRINLC